MGSILGPTWDIVSHRWRALLQVSLLVAEAAVSMVGIQVIFVSYYEASVYISYIAVHW